MSTTTSPGLYQIKVGPRTTYYGQSQNLQKRENNHLHYLRKGTHNNRQLQRSFNKHGEGSFTFQPLLICETSELDRYEQALIDAHHGTPGCANIAKDAAAPTRGLKHSEEAKAKMSEVQKARWADPEARKKQSEVSKARWADPEARKKASEAFKARWADPEHRKKAREVSKARWSCPEARKKHSEAAKAQWSCPEARKKASEARMRPIEVAWASGETTIFPSGPALGAHLGLSGGKSVYKWLSGRHKIPEKHGILSVRKL